MNRQDNRSFHALLHKALIIASVLLAQVAALYLIPSNTGLVLSADACPCSEVKPLEKVPPDDLQAGIKFGETSEYKKEFDEAIKSARKFCEGYLKEHKGERNLAIVSDIDETLLDNRPCLRDRKEWNWDIFHKWVAQAEAPTLPTAEFLAWARKNGIAIFLVTGRTEKNRAATIQNLVLRNVSYDGLYLRAQGDKRPAAEMKTQFRKDIEDLGFKIVLNIGDQISDLSGGYSQECTKLPNKMYYVP